MNYRNNIWILIALIVVMMVIHQDFWYWDDGSIVLGFLPIGLFYHMLYSMAASVLALVTIKYFWPLDVEE